MILNLLQSSKINIYEKKIFLGLSLPPSKQLSSKRYQTLNYTFLSNFCLLCSSLSPWNILPEMAKYTAGGLHNFSAHFWKNEFSTKNEKKILLIIKQGTRAFWSLWAFHEIKSGFQRLLQSDAVVRRKKNQVFIMLAWFFSEFFLWYSAYLIENNPLMKYEFC